MNSISLYSNLLQKTRSDAQYQMKVLSILANFAFALIAIELEKNSSK